MRKKNRFVAAYHGMRHVFKSEQNFKIHLFAFFWLCFLHFFFRVSIIEWILLIICSSLVLICETINTAIEKMCDYISPEHDLNIGRIKDIAAASVLICTIMSVIVGIIVFKPYLMKMYYDLV